MKTTRRYALRETAIRTVFAIATGVSLLFAFSGAWAHEHRQRHYDSHHHEDEAKIYGTVEKRPQDGVGTWIVNGREVAVTANTRIKEKHGRAEEGAYVKVEGSPEGNSFVAYEIEVKRAGR